MRNLAIAIALTLTGCASAPVPASAQATLDASDLFCAGEGCGRNVCSTRSDVELRVCTTGGDVAEVVLLDEDGLVLSSTNVLDAAGWIARIADGGVGQDSTQIGEGDVSGTTPVATFNSTGEGIGTTTPSFNLDVEDGTVATIEVNGLTGGGRIRIRDTDAGTGGGFTCVTTLNGVPTWAMCP